MTTRRTFLATLGGAAALGSLPRLASAERGEIRAGFKGQVGLQLWSLRDHGPKDVAGTLAKVHGWGFRAVESAGLWGLKSAAELRAALDRAGLKCTSSHMGFERLRDDPKGAFAEASALGASEVACPWIPHGDAFTREDALKAADAFNRFGAAARDNGLRFSYHCHGYEFVPSSEGTLFDTLARSSDPAQVVFQVDVFHAHHGGADVPGLIAAHGSRVTSLHLKDMKKGFPVERGAGTAPAEADVPVGSGQIDYPAVLRAAVKAGASAYYVEDESTDPLAHIPQSVSFLERVKLS
jgi:sugar phosphate isomerase/epimerase